MLKHGVILALVVLAFSSCGKKKDKTESPYTKDPSVPLVDLNTDKDPPANPAAPAPAPSPAPAPKPGPGQHPAPVPAPKPTPKPANPDTPTKYCDKAAGDKDYPSGVSPTPGNRDGYDFGIGGGCIHRPIREVWAVTMNHELMKWVDVDDQATLQYSPPEHVNFFFSINYAVHRIITVDWDMDWYHTVKTGSQAAPQKILINYKKVRGTSHIPYWEGSIILDRVSDSVTSFAMLNQVNADQTSSQDAADTVKEVYQKLSTGTPDWEYLH